MGSRRMFLACAAASAAGFCLPAMAEGLRRADVIVVGSGAAGLAAALSARKAGAIVLVLEKNATIGGNTLVSSGIYNCPDPVRQGRQGVEDSPEFFASQTFEAGDRKADPKLVGILARGAYPTLQWLEQFGIRFKPDVFQGYGGLWTRSHYPMVSHGRGYIARLSKACEQEGIPILTGTRVTELVREGGRISGVRCESAQGQILFPAAKAVVIASGGFSANRELCTKLDARLGGMPFTGRPTATGEMLSVAQKAGAAVANLGDIQCNLGPSTGNRYRSAYHINVARHILVNQAGERFVAEDGRRDVLMRAVLAQPGSLAFSIVDSDGFQELSSLFQQASVLGERHKESFRADSLGELAAKMGVPAAAFAGTVERFNQAVRDKKDWLGREGWMMVHPIVKPPFFASRVSMAIHYTMGGLLINERAQVLGGDRKPIPGLFAAGEVTTGVHGTNRIGGNAIPDAFVFGRIAGTEAAGGSLSF